MPSRPSAPSSSVVSLDSGLPRLKPLAQVIALLMVAGGAQASQPFSAAWFAAKGAQQSAGVARPGAPLPGMTPPPLAQQQKVNQQLQRSLQNLNNTVAAIAAQQAAQAAGRQAALAAPTNIPDGLGEGGLKVDASLPFEQAWQNAKAPVQSQDGGRTTVTVEQTADRAILNWETFNIGRQTTLRFDQQSNWAVLNRVNDPSARPSQIQGRIEAGGTVMVANRNGVVFSGSSQVNVRNLVAAAANISDSQFRERGLYFDANGSQPSFTDAAGAVRVERGPCCRAPIRPVPPRQAATCCCSAARWRTPGRSSRPRARRPWRRAIASTFAAESAPTATCAPPPAATKWPPRWSPAAAPGGWSTRAWSRPPPATSL